MFYIARCMNIIFNSLLAQLVKYDVHTTREIKFIQPFVMCIVVTGCCSFCTVLKQLHSNRS